MKPNPKVSIIIPLYIVSDRFFSDLQHFDNLLYTNYEIIIVCDNFIRLPQIKNIRLVLTGNKATGPAEKRDIGFKKAKGAICAFIDDDAYPDKLWVKNAVRHLTNNKDIIAVGGPGVTPPDDDRMAQLGGMVYESGFTSGQLRKRFTPIGETTNEIKDWPAYNLFIRSDVIKKVGGWNSTFYGGEDTLICLKIIKYGKIIYDPSVVVFHHRRPLFLSHWKQIYNVGKHRGYFFKRYPETSRQLIYLLPTTLTIGFWVLLILALSNIYILIIFLSLFCFFMGLAMSNVLNVNDLVGTLLASVGIITTHMAYGIGFLNGIYSKQINK